MSLIQRLALIGCLLPTGAALAQSTTSDTTTAETETVFHLGTIVLSAGDGDSGGTTSTVKADEVKRTNRLILDDALATVPGVVAGNSGGSRNERLVYVRGFDRFQVPLSIDGIRVYLPADNRLDFGMFLTPDLSEIQVQKGYVSVLNGPGGMGGAINLVTKQPTKPFEGEARLGLEAGNRGDINGRTGYLSMGSKQENFYVQGSYLKRDFDGYYLSRDYEPTAVQGSGKRNYSDTETSRLNLKAGYTPNDTDEYVLSYTRQTGSKAAPYNVDLPYSSQRRNWEWPEWDVDSLTFYSHTETGWGYVKTRAYYNSFDNTLAGYDDYTHSTRVLGRSFDSIYDDKAYGLDLETGGDITARNTLKAALTFRRDEHKALNYPTPGVVPTPDADPVEVSKEETWSLALENTFRATEELSIVAGASFDRAEVLMADRTVDDAGYPTGHSDALNWQVAAIWEPAAGGRYHASLSSRTRFPTLFNRYSTRFGTAVPNPDLKSERALNAEVGYSGDIGPVQVEGAVFYSKIDDMMQSVYVDTSLTQTQNVGDGHTAGFEIAASWDLTADLGVTANYTYMSRKITDPLRPGLRTTDTPRHSAYLRLDWQALPQLSVAPSLELASSRLSDDESASTSASGTSYIRNAGFGLLNLDLEWQPREAVSVVFGVRNILDKNYELAAGYPEAGRSFYLTTGVSF